MGNSHLQFEACRLLISLLIDYLAPLLPVVRVGSELNFHFNPDDTRDKVVPDLYVLPCEPQVGPKVPSWMPWEHEGRVPTLVVEVVSDSYKKDYEPEDMPRRYGLLGVTELLRYDPDHAGHPRSKYARRLFSHFVRDPSGVLVEQELPAGVDRVRLVSLPFFVVHQDPYHLRLADERDPATLLPTASEVAAQALAQARFEKDRAEAEKDRAEAEKDRAEAEKDRAEAEKDRASKAELEVERLKAELAQLRAQQT